MSTIRLCKSCSINLHKVILHYMDRADNRSNFRGKQLNLILSNIETATQPMKSRGFSLTILESTGEISFQ